MTSCLFSMLCIALALCKDIRATISWDQCSISCGNDLAPTTATTSGRVIGVAGKRGPVGPKGEPGSVGPQGPPGGQGVAGIPGMSCDCSQQSEDIQKLKEEIIALRRAVSGWHFLSNGMWYKVFKTSLNYEEAKTSCINHNARLAAKGPRDPAVRREIINTWNMNTHLWIGLDDIANEGTFTWSDGVVSTSANTNWHRREPNGGRRENCGHFLGDYPGQINDSTCGSAMHYLCEAEQPSYS